MNANNLVLISDFCVYHQIEISFVSALEQQGLIEIVTVEQTQYIVPEQLPRLEKLTRLHQDLSIHAEDLDVVSELVERIEILQQQVAQLQNQLGFYEK
ncbi:MAG: chaperone modulator CbpM [Rudanella sp.]|nr:chaperone modulator CbpM [Rudanella sp.]